MEVDLYRSAVVQWFRFVACSESSLKSFEPRIQLSHHSWPHPGTSELSSESHWHLRSHLVQGMGYAPSSETRTLLQGGQLHDQMVHSLVLLLIEFLPLLLRWSPWCISLAHQVHELLSTCCPRGWHQVCTLQGVKVDPLLVREACGIPQKSTMLHHRVVDPRRIVVCHGNFVGLQKGIPCLRKGTSYSYSIPSLPIQGKNCKWICARSPIFQTSNSRMEIEQSWKPLLLDDMVAWFLPICSKPQDQTKTTKVFQACFHVLLFPLIFFAH